jgi:hypothetical protein
MRARLVVLVVLAVLAAVAALGAAGVVDLGFLGGGRTAPADAAPPEDVEGAERDAARLATRPGSRTKRPGEEDAAGAPTAPEIPSEVAGTSPTGASIRGRVVRSDAKIPVEGATVRLTKPDSLFHYLRASRAGRYDDLTARTDDKGRFTFRDVLPSEGYALLAREGTGAAVTRLGIAVVARQQKDVDDLVLGPAGGLGGRVVDGAGQPIPGVRVAVTWQVKNDFQVILADPDSLPWIEGEGKTDADGRWVVKALEPGDKTVVLKAPSGASDVLSPISVDAGEQRTDVDATLGGTLAIAGKVAWKGGAPIEGARVFAKSARKASAWSMDTGPDGAFRIGGLTAGKYMVGALVAGLPIEIRENVEPGEGTVLEFEPVGSLSGTVVSKATRRTIPRFRVDARYQGELDYAAQYVTQQLVRILGAAPFERPDGAFRFERLRAGTYVLAVEADGYPKTVTEKEFEVKVGEETTGAVVELAEGHSASGVVLDAAGAVVGARVYLVPDEDLKDSDAQSLAQRIRWGEFDEEDTTTRTDDQGKFDSGPLTPGVYAIVAVPEGRLPAMVKGVDVRTASKGDLALRVPRGGSIRVKVLDHRGRPAKAVRLAAVTAENSVIVQQESEEDGTADLKPVGEGRWVVARESAAVQRILHGGWDPVAKENIPSVTDLRQRYERLRSLGGEEVTVSEAQSPSLTVRLPRLCTLKGRVRVKGRPHAESWVWMIDGNGHFVASAQTDLEGRFQVHHVEPGTVQAYVNVGEAEDGRGWVPSPVVVPDAEETTVELER